MAGSELLWVGGGRLGTWRRCRTAANEDDLRDYHQTKQWPEWISNRVFFYSQEPGNLEKWVPSCQRSSEAGYIVLERACSVFKRPHKTLTVLPLFALTPQSRKKHEIPGKRKPQPSFCPVLTLLSLTCHYATSFSDVYSILLNVIYCRFSQLLFPSVICSQASAHSLAFIFSKFFLFSFYPHQNSGHGSLEYSRLAQGEHLCVHECWQSMRLIC